LNGCQTDRLATQDKKPTLSSAVTVYHPVTCRVGLSFCRWPIGPPSSCRSRRIVHIFWLSFSHRQVFRVHITKRALYVCTQTILCPRRLGLSSVDAYNRSLDTYFTTG